MPKIKVFCRKVNCINAQFVLSIADGEITPQSGYSLFQLDTEEVNVSETAKNSDAGSFVNQSFDFRLNKPSTYLNSFIRAGFVFQLLLSNGSKLVFGSVKNPAYFASGSATKDVAKMKFSRQATQFEFTENGSGITVDITQIPDDEITTPSS
jgi:hypothetical protein